MTFEEMQAKMEIRELVDRFQNFETNVDEQVKCFTEDVNFILYTADGQKLPEVNGRENLHKAFTEATKNIVKSHHMNGQQVVTMIDENHATGVLYCRMTLTNKIDGVESTLDHRLYYEDTYEKQSNGQWLIKQRISHFVMSL